MVEEVFLIFWHGFKEVSMLQTPNVDNASFLGTLRMYEYEEVPIEVPILPTRTGSYSQTKADYPAVR